MLSKLAGQTAIYGLPSMVGRLLNYLLVILHTNVFLTSKFGVITEMYAYVGFLVVLLTYGMETAYFRYQSKSDYPHQTVYSTVLSSITFSTLVFVLAATLFSQNIANAIKYPDNSEYVVWFAFIVGLDAISSIPLARLRIENQAFRFAMVNIVAILVNIGLNVFWIAYCIPQYEAGVSNFFIDSFYSPTIGVGYVFLANLFSSAIKFLLLSPQMLKINRSFDTTLLKRMVIYGSPLLIANLAIIVNEHADKILLKWLLIGDMSEEVVMSMLGIYGGCYKLSIVITLFIQAFRYAAEPFFFAQEKEKNAKQSYARIMKYFVITCAFIFLVVSLFIDLFKHFLSNPDYWEGLHVVPILLFANIFLGIFYNLSVWYKLTGKTRFGALIASIGAVITIVANLILIPLIQYTGSAWATLLCYSSMVVISYLLGQKYYKINYPLKKIGFYLLLSLALYGLGICSKALLENINQHWINSILILGFIAVVLSLEKPKKMLIS